MYIRYEEKGQHNPVMWALVEIGGTSVEDEAYFSDQKAGYSTKSVPDVPSLTVHKTYRVDGNGKIIDNTYHVIGDTNDVIAFDRMVRAERRKPAKEVEQREAMWRERGHSLVMGLLRASILDDLENI